MIFNPAQKEAIQHNTGPCMVLAGPGSGKTAVLSNRVKYLIDNYEVHPSDILVITFTKAAAVQMKERFLSLSEGRGAAVTFGTFHAVFFTILKNAYNYSAKSIITSDVQQDYIREQMCALELEYDDESEAVADIIAQISCVKSGNVNIDTYECGIIPPESFRVIFRNYDRMLRNRGLLDFDDMILMCLELLTQREDYRNAWQDRYRYILVDEFQDINRAQFDVIRLLSGKYNNLFVVGDDDQSIYGFRGSDPGIMLQFSDAYSDAKRIDLNINYRSTGNIVLAAKSVIEENEKRFSKDIETNSACGEAVDIYEFINLNDEKKFLAEEIIRLKEGGIDYNDIAVLSRTNIVGNLYMARLKGEGIPCVSNTRQEDIYDHWIAKDIFSYLRIAQGSNSRKDFLRIINKPLRYIKRSYISEPVDMDALKIAYTGNVSMCERIDRLIFDIKLLRNMSPFAALNYIRKGIGYDEYISNYIYEHKANKEEINNILSELLHRAEKCNTVREWLEDAESLSNDIQTECKRGISDEHKGGVHFLTMHCSKGLEYKVVFVTDVCEGIIPYNKAVLEDHIEEERRLFYVAMTRAKEKLYLMYPKLRYNKDTARSRFIEDILTTRYPHLHTVLHTP
ncbi:MAG: ATP-dependent helicase [Lachnospira sp.]|nr:ATP-dependent helicase [Lachnospira sp.]